MKVVAVAGAFDVKGSDYRFLIDQIHWHGVETLSIDFGVLADPPFIPEISSTEVARAGGGNLDELRARRDKTAAMRTMTDGLRSVVSRLQREGRIDGACGMGGTGGTAVLSAAFRELPLGFPKLVVSTVAGTDVSAYVGARDITMMPSIADIAGINRISRKIYTNAAAAISGMVAAGGACEESDRPLVATSMFGNTTACVDRARGVLEAHGFEVLTFHATGLGGRLMQSLASDRLVCALLDLTTTELADEVCGGVFTAGRDRVRLGAHSPIPVVLAPGCV
ncbi:MAG TPA: Tm-1-like ATP-binding domain-containing protein, partial [Bryobacteraceae bacterium]|nr:Tm-1-like ATP-binding domain-containing protein [Bryobacteraceae bacterium]